MRRARLVVVQGDLTRQRVDAVVNAANNRMRGGGGVDGAIHRAGGPSVLRDCEARFPDGLATGDAGWTTAGEMPARWVIHTVGPNYGAGQTDRRLLVSCYRRCLEVADGLGAATVAFPLLSAGVYSWPLHDAVAAAVDTLVTTPTQVREVRLVAHGDVTHEAVLASLVRWTPRRLLEGVRVLHARGFEQVRALPGMSPSGVHWRLTVADRAWFAGGRPEEEALRWTSGAGSRVAGGSVTAGSTPDEVADLLVQALPHLGAAEDREYAEWFAGLLDRVEEEADPRRGLPVAYADEDGPGDGSWEIGWGSGRRWPGPPG